MYEYWWAAPQESISLDFGFLAAQSMQQNAQPDYNRDTL